MINLFVMIISIGNIPFSILASLCSTPFRSFTHIASGLHFISLSLSLYFVKPLSQKPKLSESMYHFL